MRRSRLLGLPVLLTIIISLRRSTLELRVITESWLGSESKLLFGESTSPSFHNRTLAELPIRRRGEVSCQTRRNATVTLPTYVPDFVIAGVAKGGTTALQGFLEKHPDIIPSYTFETHFFDVRMKLDGKTPSYRDIVGNPGAICELQKQYYRFFPVGKLVDNPRLFSFEKTPVYFVHESIAATLKEVVPWTKVVVVLRNPVDRLYSHFKLLYERQELHKNTTFEAKIAHGMQELRNAGIRIPSELLEAFMEDIPPLSSQKSRRGKFRKRSIIYRGFYADQLRNWLKHFDLGETLLLVQFERMEQEPQTVINEICDFVGIPRYEYPEEVFAERYNPNEKRGPIREGTPPMSDRMRELLTRFYRHFNKDLADFAGEEWRGMWDMQEDDDPDALEQR